MAGRMRPVVVRHTVPAANRSTILGGLPEGVTIQPARTRRPWRRAGAHGLALALVVAAVGLIVPGTSNAFTWGLPASTLSTVATTAQAAQVAVAPDGTTTVVWSQTNPTESSSTVIMAATRLRGQAGFGAPQRISGPALGAHVEPKIAVGPDGTAVVVWKEGGIDEIFATTRAAGQTSFPDDAPQLLYPASGSLVLSPDVAAAPDGSFTAVWVAGTTVMAATRLAGETGFSGSPDLLGTGDGVELPRLAAAPDGSIVAVWTGVTAGVGATQTRTRPAGQRAFGPSTTLSTSTGDARAPEVAAGEDGQVTVVWSAGWGGQIWSATRMTPASAFGAPVPVPAIIGLSPQVVVAPNGETTVVWNENLQTIRSSTRAPGESTWGPAEVVGTAGNPSPGDPPTGRVDDPSVAVARDGRITVFWIDSGNYPLITSIFSATRAGGAAAWSSPTQLDPGAGPGNPPTPAPMGVVAPDGSVTAVWRSVVDPSPGAATPNMIIKTAGTEATSYTVTVATAGDGSGTVGSRPTGIDCGATCTASIPLSTPLALTAQAAAGSSFAGWGGACAGTSSTCTVSVLGDRSVTATFTRNPATAGPSAARRPLKVKTGTSRNGAAVTSGVVPDSATRVVQTVAQIGARRAKTRTVRCSITRADGVRTFRCRVTLAAGRWRLTTKAMAGSVVVAQSVRKVTVRARKPAALTGASTRLSPLTVLVAVPSATPAVRSPASTR